MDVADQGEGLVFGIPVGVDVTGTPRRSQQTRNVPKRYKNYTGGHKLDEVLGVKKSASPKDEKTDRGKG